MQGAAPQSTATVTFLFTDIEGSTGLWERQPADMAAALARHDHILRAVIDRHLGRIFSTAGDGCAAVFPTARGAAEAAIEAQRSLGSEQWPGQCELKVRMGIHTGEAEERANDYFGPPVNLCARLMSTAHGGQVVCSAATGELLHGAVELRDLGEHRLRDVASPVRALQIVASGLLDGFPALRSVTQARTNLPAEVDTFIGREEETRALCEAVRATPLVTLVGTGGVGKTRVAVRSARALLDEFRDGVWLCELARVREAEEVAEAVASALNFVPPQGVQTTPALVEHLSRRETLLVLDNCEHVLDGVADLAGLVMATSGSSRMLATSRAPLQLAGEHLFPLRPLEVPSDDDIEHVRQSEAGALFCARAGAVRSGFRLDGPTGAAVAEICRRLDGIPLALELAAARVAVMDPQEIVRRLDRRFAVLRHPRRGHAPRHQTLQAAIDWSYDLLGPDDKRLLQQLAVFVGGFDLDAVVGVATRDGFDEFEAIDMLAALVSKSLVEAGDVGSGRYWMLETIREYTLERLGTNGDLSGGRQRHAEHVLVVVEEQLTRLRGAGAYEAVDRLALDAGNLALAGEWLASTGQAHRVLQLFPVIPSMTLPLLPQSLTDILVGIAHAATTEDVDPASNGYSAACCYAAAASFFSGRLDLIDQFLVRGRRSPPDHFLAQLRTVLCGVHGDMATGVALAEEALRLLGPDGDPLWRAQCLSLLAIFLTPTDAALARRHAEHSVELARRHGGPLAQLYPLLGLVTSTARVDFGEALAVAAELGRLDRTTRRIYSNLGIGIAMSTGDPGDRSVEDLTEFIRPTIEQLHEAGARGQLPFAIAALAEATAEDDPELALRLVSLVEGPAIASTAILVNVSYLRLRAVAAEMGPRRVEDLRHWAASMSYDEAMVFVFGAIDRLMSRG